MRVASGVCGYMISIFWVLCIPLCLRSLRAFSSAYVLVIAGICRSCSVLVFVLWLFGVCVVVVMVVCACFPAAFVCFVCDCLLLLLCDGVCCGGDDCVCGFLRGLWLYDFDFLDVVYSVVFEES